MNRKEIYQLKELFADVQMQKVFADGKTFPDCTAKFSLDEIEEKYLRQKNDPGFDLSKFVYENFELPVSPQSDYHSQEEDVVDHINNLWNVLTRKADTASRSTAARSIT